MSTSTINLSSLRPQMAQERVDREIARADSGKAAQALTDVAATRENNVSRIESQEAQPKDAQAQRDELNEAIERVSQLDHRLSFTVDEDSGKSVVVVRDAQTSEVLKQFPSEEMLNVARRMEEHLANAGDAAGLLHVEEA